MKIFFSKCPKLHQLNIIKITKKYYKKARERYQSPSKEEKDKKNNNNIVVNNIKISQKIRNKRWKSIEKNILK